MTLQELIDSLRTASTRLLPDTEVTLVDEDAVLSNHSAPRQSLTDVRIESDWALPGQSLIYPEEPTAKLLLLYSARSQDSAND